MLELNFQPIEQRTSADHFCSTNSKLAMTSMQWTIKNFNVLKFDSELCLESSSFESVQDGTSTGSWHLKLVTKPMYSNDGKIALFFVYHGYRRGLFVGLEAWIVDSDGKTTNKKKICYELDSAEVGFHEFIQKSKLVDSLLPNGDLTIHSFVAVVPLDSTEVKTGKRFGEKSQQRGFSNLLKKGVFSDVVLVCGDKRFNVHKCILSARSSVFRELFQQNIEDDVKIEDMEADVLENLLSYIYLDNIRGKCAANMAVKLLIGAEKYRLMELKEICEKYLETNVAVQNFLEVASTADLHNLNSLKEVCVNFMYAHGREIVFPYNFKEFFNTAPHYLLDGVLKKILEGSQSFQKKQLPPSTPSLISQAERLATCSASVIRYAKQQATVKGTQSSAYSSGLPDDKRKATVKGTQSSLSGVFAASIPPSIHNDREQAVVKRSPSPPKETNFIFGLPAENHPVFSPNEKQVPK